MERQIKVVARYHCEHNYYVEVSSEDSVIANRDYWLCRRGSSKKLFMFSSPCMDVQTEERKILDGISDAIRAFESADTGARYA